MRKFVAVLLFVAIVFPLLTGALSLIAVSQWVLDRNFYQQLLGDERLYEVLLAEDIPNYINNRQPVRGADMLPVGALSNALRTVVSPTDLREQSLRMVNDVFDVLDGRSATLDLYLDTTQIKTALRGAGAEEFARALVSHLPACTAGQSAVISGGTLMRCLPADLSVNDATAQVVAALPTFLANVPDRIELQGERFNWRYESYGWNMAMGASGALSAALAVMLFIAGGAWLLTGLLFSSVPRERLLALGMMLVVPAVLMLIIGASVSAPLATGWLRFGLNEAQFDNGVMYSPAFREAVLVVTSGALRTIASGFLMAGAASGALAAGLMLWGAASPRAGHNDPVPATTITPGPTAGQA